MTVAVRRPVDGAPARAERFTRPGGASVGADQIASVQRARMVGAMIDVSCERGGGSVSVADVVERSGVSRRTFYEIFADKDDCFLASFERGLTLASERILCESDASADWRERIRAGLVALLRFLDEEPRLGSLLVVESAAAAPMVAARRNETIAKLTAIVEQGRDEERGTSLGLPAVTGEGVVGAVLTVLASRIVDPGHESLLGLANELMSMIVLPYLGPDAARRELERPLPPAPSGERARRPLLSDPFKEAGMRLTYRTMRVLTAVAEHPGGSNRQIGTAAEITDQGQISKLLTRLERSGMVANTGPGAGQGGPNAWTLTDIGRRIVSTLGAHADDNVI